VIYCVLLFCSLENYHNYEEELGDGNEKRKGDPQTGEGGPYDEDQGCPECTSVSQGMCLLQTCGYAVLLGHVTFCLSRDIVNETCQCPYNTWKVHFRALLMKNN